MTRKHLSIWPSLLAFVTILSLAPACGGDDDGGVDPNLPVVDCVTVPVYDDLALINSCTGCHSSTLPSAMRSGAPVGVDYDNYDAAVASAERGAIRVNVNTMPPGGAGGIPATDKEAYYNWALCGTPQ